MDAPYCAHRRCWLPGSSPVQPDLNVGRRIRQLREACKLSMRELAGASGLAPNTLSLIENNRTSPSISTLQQIAHALGVNITTFFEPPDEIHVAYVRANERLPVVFNNGVMEYLGAGSCRWAMQPCLVTLKPGVPDNTAPVLHTGYEFFYGLSGLICCAVENKSYLLEPGDSLLFEASQPHSWRNVCAGLSQMLLVLIMTDANDQPAGHHFALLDSANMANK
jgi:transcriptional regulator with XRE-family HTH domain